MINIEGLFSTNIHNKPTVITGKLEIAVLLIRILLTEQQTNPLQPDMGVGIMTRYKAIEEDDLENLNKDIYNQIKIFMPLYQAVQIDLTIEQRELNIGITIDDTLYSFTTGDSESNQVISLSNIKEYGGIK